MEPNNYYKPNMYPLFKKKGFLIQKFKDKNFLTNIKKIVKKHFTKSTDFYCKMDTEKFRKIALKCQKEISKSKIQEKFFNSEKKFLKKLCKNDEVWFESVVFLRVVRPMSISKTKEELDFHRETFYNPYQYAGKSINLWFPIMNVNEKNTLRYIPGSHMINDKKILRRRVSMTKKRKKTNLTKRFSAGHKLGFIYHPMKIVKGIDIKKQKKMIIPENHYSVFSSSLVHGNGTNYTKKIRFAMGFGLIRKSLIKKNKPFHHKRFGSKNNKIYTWSPLSKIKVLN
tara:strand:+ start:1593 stop:2441 length:849 start_codon:yes stop_codon:yes gene_type:complete